MNIFMFFDFLFINYKNMANIQIEIDEKYREVLDLLKQVIPSPEGTEIKEDSKMIESLIDSFMAFLQEQAWEWSCGTGEEKEGGCCGGGSCETN